MQHEHRFQGLDSGDASLHIRKLERERQAFGEKKRCSKVERDRACLVRDRSIAAEESYHAAGEEVFH